MSNKIKWHNKKSDRKIKTPSALRRYYRLNTAENLKKGRDPWERWPAKSQFFRYGDLLDREEKLQKSLKEDGIEDYHSRFFFESEEEREKMTRELLVDLRFKVLFFLHVLIEKGDREATLFALKELLQKGFVAEELEKLDERTVANLEKFLKEK